MSRTSRTAAPGFTLVELMTVVAIVGILTSVALPQFVSFQARSRAAERAVIMRQVQASVADLWLRNGKFPEDLGSGRSELTCESNPPGLPGSSKRVFQERLGKWADLTITIEGAVYYSYSVTAVAGDGRRDHFLTAEGDLDADGDSSFMTRAYAYDHERPPEIAEAEFGGAF